MSNNSQQTKPSGPGSLQDILHAANTAGRFEAVVLASAGGLPIASAPAGYDGDVTAAIVALLRKVSSDAQQLLGMAEVEEVTIRSRDRVRLVCRQINIDKESLILVAIVPPGRFYRRVTNRAIRQIRELLS